MVCERKPEGCCLACTRHKLFCCPPLRGTDEMSGAGTNPKRTCGPHWSSATASVCKRNAPVVYLLMGSDKIKDTEMEGERYRFLQLPESSGRMPIPVETQGHEARSPCTHNATPGVAFMTVITIDC